MDLVIVTCSVLRGIINDPKTTGNQCSETDGVYDAITTFEFVFILHLMREILEITDDLCQALQCQSQDILNAMHLMATTKEQIQKFREDGCVLLREKVTRFYGRHKISVPDMNAPYVAGRGCVQKDPITIEHYFRMQVFICTVDSQLQELNTQFKKDTMELLILSTSQDPRDGFISFDIEDTCKLAETYYPMDFTEQKRYHLRYQLQYYKLDVSRHPEFQKLSTISKSSEVLTKIRK